MTDPSGDGAEHSTTRRGILKAAGAASAGAAAAAPLSTGAVAEPTAPREGPDVETEADAVDDTVDTVIGDDGSGDSSTSDAGSGGDGGSGAGSDDTTDSDPDDTGSSTTTSDGDGNGIPDPVEDAFERGI